MANQNSPAEYLRMLIAILNHCGGCIELNPQDLAAPEQGDGILWQIENGKTVIRKVDSRASYHFLGMPEPEAVSEVSSKPFQLTDELLVAAESMNRRTQ